MLKIQDIISFESKYSIDERLNCAIDILDKLKGQIILVTNTIHNNQKNKFLFLGYNEDDLEDCILTTIQQKRKLNFSVLEFLNNVDSKTPLIYNMGLREILVLGKFKKYEDKIHSIMYEVLEH